MSDQDTHLAEAILAIQHEIQLALDYIETVVRQEASELGAASSLITVENLRVRIPFVFQTEQEIGPVPSEEKRYFPGIRLPPEELRRLKGKLASRPGLLLGSQDGQGRFVKIRVTSPVFPAPAPDDEPTTPVEPLVGEIEVNLTRVPRDLEGGLPETTSGGESVPDVVGRTLEGATRLLKDQGWDAEPHVASEEDISAFPTTRPGRVLRQEPIATSRMDKQTTVVHFWLVLSTLPVSEIDGIGPVREARLAEAGIGNVGELSLAGAVQVAAALGVSEARAQSFIDMADFMSRLTIAGLRDEVIEILVKGVNIRSMEELAAAAEEELYRASLQAVTSKQVRVPKSFSFTQKDVQDWIKAAQSSLGQY